MNIPSIEKKVVYFHEPIASKIVGETFWNLLNMSERLLLDECFRMLAMNSCYVLDLGDGVLPYDNIEEAYSNTARD